MSDQIKCKIFVEDEWLERTIEERINVFFEDLEDAEIVSMNTTTKKIKGEDQLVVNVLYK